MKKRKMSVDAGHELANALYILSFLLPSKPVYIKGFQPSLEKASILDLIQTWNLRTGLYAYKVHVSNRNTAPKLLNSLTFPQRTPRLCFGLSSMF